MIRNLGTNAIGKMPNESMKASLEIRVDDLRGPQIISLLENHLATMRSISPPESCHALDLEELRQSDITFWSIWDGPELAGCGALKELDREHAEIKSMRTAEGAPAERESPRSCCGT